MSHMLWFKNISATDRMASNGFGLMGRINVPFSRLVQVFGEPTDADGEKVAFEWIIRVQDGPSDLRGTVLTIYDYKETSLYEPGLPSPEELRRSDFSGWHVGGRDRRAVELVERILREAP